MAVNALDVFVNCPFDLTYKPIFNAIVFTVVRSGYRARCALETDNAAENRLEKICTIVAECRFGIHDISRTEVDGDPPMPRFNMPLELGLFLGARRYGNKQQKAKACIVFDREPYRYQRFISDIAGQDIHAHHGDIPTLIRELATWLRTQPGGAAVPGGTAISVEYTLFESLLPAICAARRLTLSELGFGDFNEIVTEYVAMQKTAPDPSTAS
jgi:hypothetical protein